MILWYDCDIYDGWQKSIRYQNEFFRNFTKDRVSQANWS